VPDVFDLDRSGSEGDDTATGQRKLDCRVGTLGTVRVV